MKQAHERLIDGSRLSPGRQVLRQPCRSSAKFGQTLPRERGGRFYRDLAVGGQIGRTDLNLPWEALDGLDALRVAAGRAAPATAVLVPGS